MIPKNEHFTIFNSAEIGLSLLKLAFCNTIFLATKHRHNSHLIIMYFYTAWLIFDEKLQYTCI